VLAVTRSIAYIWHQFLKTNKDGEFVARKRAPGGGRKPQGEFRGKTTTFTTRITPDLRRGLEREARRAARSLSQEVERRLRDSLEHPKKIRKQWGDGHVWALASLISRAVRSVELSTGKHWVTDPYTSRAIRTAIEVILNDLMPKGPMEIPERIEDRNKSVTQTRPEEADFFRHPEGLGTACALGLLYALSAYEPPPLNHSSNEHYADSFYEMPKLRHALGIKKDRCR
jgi:hypothetical protein